MEFSENEYINELIRRKNSIHFKIIHKYSELLNQCLNRIRYASGSGKTDLFYVIPKFIFGFNEYNYKECCSYIIKRLRNLYMDVTTIDDNTIFISWYYIEINRKNALSKQ